MNNQATLFDLFPAPEPKAKLPKSSDRAQKIKTMWALHGKKADATCSRCTHLLRQRYHDKTYLKCDLTEISRGVGSDWRAGWIACGKFETKS